MIMFGLLVSVVTVLLHVPSAWAVGVVRYVDATAGTCTGNYSITNRNCTGTDGNSYATVSAGVTATAAGDILYIRAGTYNASMPDTIVSGVSSASPTIISGYTNESVTLRPTSGQYVINIAGNADIVIRKLILDAGSTIGHTIRIANASARITIENNEILNSFSNGVIVGFDSPDCIIRNNWVHDNGDAHQDHGLYISGDRTIVEGNLIEANADRGMQLYPGPIGAVVRRNIFKDNCRAINGTNVTFGSASSNTVFEQNVFWDTVPGRCHTDTIIQGTGHKLYNNTAYSTSATASIGYSVLNATNVTLANNIALGMPTPISQSGSTGTVLTTNRTTGTATDIWTSPSTGDFSLKSGSAAINAGTNVALPFCGSSPDQGVHETLVVTAASIAGNTLDVTVCSAVPPVQPLGTWTPACTGTGCGTPVSGSVSIVGGGVVRIPVSGITGGNCAAGQTWTISASGANTDSALIGNSQNQTLHTVTSFAVDSSACNGSGTSTLPGGALAIYELDGNTNDSSGNANHAIGSANIAYVTGKYGQGAQTTAALNSYIDTGLLNGTNPSSTHVVIATGVYIAPGQLSDTADIFGTDLGTNQKLIVYRSNTNIWKMILQGTTGTDTEFPVVSGWTHVCLKMNATTDVATLYVNGVAGALTNASTIAYTSYTLPSTLRFGLPVGFSTSLSGTQIFDRAVIYTTDVSCTDIYDNWEPAIQTAMVAQATHQWQGVYTLSGSAENRGSADAQRTVAKGGAAALMTQVNCTGGDCGVLQPRLRYNVNGGTFASVIPDTPTADGVSMWGAATSVFLNNGVADGPISGALAHTDGITLTTSAQIPTITMGNNTSYTLRWLVKVDAAIDDVVCFKMYDQGGSALTTYTPAAGACLTVISPQASGAF